MRGRWARVFGGMVIFFCLFLTMVLSYFQKPVINYPAEKSNIKEVKSSDPHLANLLEDASYQIPRYWEKNVPIEEADIVLIHGMSNTWFMLRGVAAFFLEKKGLNVHILEVPGHIPGIETDFFGPDNNLGWKDFQKDLVKKFQKAGRPMVVWGHSFGALQALMAMNTNPELIKAAVLVCPSSPYPYNKRGTTWQLKRVAIGQYLEMLIFPSKKESPFKLNKTAVTLGVLRYLPRDQAEIMYNLRVPEPGKRVFEYAFSDATEVNLPGIEQPILVQIAENDIMANPRTILEWQPKLENSRAILYPEEDHSLPLKSQLALEDAYKWLKEEGHL
jgi:pimeloyl-ACP methyl ester carboxylesterase